MSLLKTLSRIVRTALPNTSAVPNVASSLSSAGFGAVPQCHSLASFLQTRLASSASPGLGVLAGRPGSLAAAGSSLWQRWGGSSNDSRGFASKLTPRFTGGKLKPYSSYKERFKMTGSGKIRYMRPGSVHKHFNKGNRQNRDLAKSKVLYETYAKTMRKLGFKMRNF